MPSKQSFRYCFTLNNWVDNDEAILAAVHETHLNYLIYGKEVSPTTNTPHLQGFLTLKKKISLAGLKKLFGTRYHWEATEGTSLQASTYCKKDGDVTEFGTPPTPGKRNDLNAIAQAIKDGQSLEEAASIDPATYVRNYRGLANYQALLSKDYAHDDVRGIWLHGPPGTGKSHHARLFAESKGTLYVKPQNKWFDGYSGEDSILLDDLDSNCLGHHLKIWSDKYACSGEIKGGTVKLRHKYFIVTSNYHPNYLWPDKDQDGKPLITVSTMSEAVSRRFHIIRLDEQTDSIPQLDNLN